MRVPLYTRLPRRTHRLLHAYARASKQTLNDVVEALIVQLLFQVSVEFEAPQWLTDAVASHDLPIERCSHVIESELSEDEEERGNVIRFGR